MLRDVSSITLGNVQGSEQYDVLNDASMTGGSLVT